MKVKVIEGNRKFMGEFYSGDLLKDKVYEVIALEEVIKNHYWYRIIDESKEDYMYPPELFEIVEE